MSELNFSKQRDFLERLRLDFEASFAERDRLLLQIMLTTIARGAVRHHVEELRRLLTERGAAVEVPWNMRHRRGHR